MAKVVDRTNSNVSRGYELETFVNVEFLSIFSGTSNDVTVFAQVFRAAMLGDDTAPNW